MLRELHISNLAVIEDVCIELTGGLNCFTGQTGAGKSLIIGAFELLLGLRSGSAADMIRSGANEARVTGVFDLQDPQLAKRIATIADLPAVAAGDESQGGGAVEADELLITRKLFRTGRSSVSVNGQPATATMVRQIGEFLVDVHGQHDHQYLLKPLNQLEVLDNFAKCNDLCKQFGELHRELTDTITLRRELNTSSDLRRQQLDLYEFQLDEIERVDPQPGEYEQLKVQNKRMSQVQRLKNETGAAHAALYDSEGSIVERLQVLTQLLMELHEFDDDIADITEQVRTSTLSLQEAAYEMTRYSDRLEVDPVMHADVEERLNALNRLISKYDGGQPLAFEGEDRDDASDDTASDGQNANGGDLAIDFNDALAGVLHYRMTIDRQITQLRGQTADAGELDDRIEQIAAQLRDVGQELSETRRHAAGELEPLVNAELNELGMADAKLSVSFKQVAVADSTAGQLAKCSPTGGFDELELLIQANPGQPARPLRKVASGGEMSRIMLAIKSILAGNDRISVLVFDEIDANIGGRMGTVIGRKLRELTAGVSHRSRNEISTKKKTKAKSRSSVSHAELRHQVLCITHLPQIAAFADRHLRIAKSVTGKGKTKVTTTTVLPVEGKTRIEELAEMLTGKDATKTTLKQVEEMIEAAG